MASYRIELKKSAEKDVNKLPSDAVSRIDNLIGTLAENPLPPGVRKLQGTETFYRIRAGNYRVIYAVDPKEKIIVIHYVRHRKDAYRRL